MSSPAQLPDETVAPAAPALSLYRKLAIGIGDFGFNFYWQIASLYLLYFYTDVLKLPPATAGAIYMAALIWDAVLDPVVGLFVDKTRSRFGRYRIYLVLGSIVATLWTAVILLLYADTRMRKEGMDLILQQAAQSQRLTGDEFATYAPASTAPVGPGGAGQGGYQPGDNQGGHPGAPSGY